VRLLAGLRVLAAAGALVGLLYGLLVVPAPSVPWHGLSGWLERTPSEDALVAVAHLLAIAGVLVVLATTALYGLAVVGRAPALARVVGRWTLPVVRRALDAAVTSTVLVGLVTSSARASEPQPGPTIVVLAEPAYVPIPAGADLNEVPESGSLSSVLLPGPTQSSMHSPPAAEPSKRVDGGYFVQRGDNLWTIASTELFRVNGVEPTAREVRTYWLTLIAENRSRLVSGDPNLIYAGEVLVLPTPST
jgi:hypothetical protein